MGVGSKMPRYNNPNPKAARLKCLIDNVKIGAAEDLGLCWACATEDRIPCRKRL